MEKNILYIILGIGWFLFNAWLKKQRKDKAEAENTSEEAPEREIIRERRPSPPPAPEYEEAPSFEKVLEELMGTKKEQKSEAKEIRAQENRDRFTKVVPQKAPTRKVEGGSHEHEFERFEEFETVKETSDSIASDLFADQDAAKKAFIASEIFNRKY